MVNLVPLLVVCALVWWFVRRKKRSHREKAASAPVLVDAKHGVFVRPDSEDEQRIAALHREATEHKASKEWDKAIACLQEAERLKPKVATIYPVKHALRLPLFLQQAGRFDEAMQEFQKLLDGTEARIAHQFSHQKKTVQKKLAHADYADIYKAMSTACKREKRMDLTEKYQNLSKK